jgi:decaprenyl-phosphate phosphoribosyltransferase
MDRAAWPPLSPQPRAVSAVAVGLLRAMRPRQWVKNVLVLAAPFAAGLLLKLPVLYQVALAFVAFCLAASGVYLVNDGVDASADRAHPRKRNRPVAAGLVPPRLAVGAAVVALLAGIGVASLASADLVVVILLYEALAMAYCLRLKAEPVLDLAIVAGGFLLRAVAGGAATGIPLSQWFLLVAAFGSLFMVAGKRFSERQLASRNGSELAGALARYSDTYLRFVWSTSTAVVITTYGLWAFELQARQDSVWAPVSMAPFVLAILRYAIVVDGGHAGEPEDVALADRVLQVLAVAWVATLAAGLYR